ncbi:MAG: NarK/NasA family nitrate transporter [Actinobacteria bacterium]|nr:NarK/NasA family nitrate transporter [Actinomycetota bacterium]
MNSNGHGSGTVAQRPPETVTATSVGHHDVAPEARRVLVISTAVFTLFFAVWVMFAIVAIPIKKEFKLSEGDFALLVALPVLTGSLLRIPVGIMTDKIGGRTMMTSLLVLTAIPTYLVSRVQTYEQTLWLALFVGLAGVSFAVGIAWVSAWYPAKHQGFALGVFGTGNVGASITKLLAPTLVTLVGTGGLLGGLLAGGWRFVPSIYALFLVCTAAIVWFATPKPDKRPSQGRSIIEMSRPLAIMRVWRFGFYYVTVFGAYVGMSLWLPHYYVDVYGLELRNAGFMTAIFIFPASLLRPLGGSLSDRFGARPITFISFSIIAAASAVLCMSMSMWPFTLFVLIIGVAMGIGKASVYTYIPQYFPKDVGAVGGLVGAIGGMGGFVLPLLFAWAKVQSGRPESTFYVMLGLSLVSLLFLSIAVARILSGARAQEM